MLAPHYPKARITFWKWNWTNSGGANATAAVNAV
jgi:hypothetical protein